MKIVLGNPLDSNVDAILHQVNCQGVMKGGIAEQIKDRYPVVFDMYKFDTSLLMITHNLGIISELCRNVAVMYAGAIIEYGSVKEVFKKPLHPYTKGLLGAIPTLDDDKERLMAIRGAVADPYHLPRGCSFYPRCDKCRAECEGQYPPLTKITDNHYVACWCHKEG